MLSSIAACGPAVASPVLDAAIADAELLRPRVFAHSAASAEMDAATILALTSIAPAAGDPGQPLARLGTREGAATGAVTDVPVRRAVRGLVREEPRSAFVDDPACGFAQDVSTDAASLDCGTPVRFALSTISGLSLLTRPLSAPVPDLRFAIASDALVSAIPVPGMAWLLAALSVLLAMRASAFRLRTPR